ncbi:MAG: hypothetical protein NVSMB64_31740 [Candidatus Velthaea sp.]
MIPVLVGLATSPNAPLEALNRWTASLRSYRYEVAATERFARSEQTTLMRIEFDAARADETVTVEAGRGKGSRLVGHGDRVMVRPPGALGMIRVNLPVRDARLLSERGNDIRTAILGPIVDCFQSHIADVTTSASKMSGETTIVLARHTSGTLCSDNPRDSDVTTDRLIIDTATGRPLRRERYAGPMLVESWTIRELSVVTT